MSKRTTRAQTAAQTLEILERGTYVAPDGKEVSIKDMLADSISGTKLYRPDDFSELRNHKLNSRSAVTNTEIRVTDETTLGAACRLFQTYPDSDVLALNFASAKNPGGGFLNGSQAQEESLARASGLYACINPVQEYYQVHRSMRSCLYTDHMIYAPHLPVFRDDDDRLLETPYPLSMITSPAVNAGVVRQSSGKGNSKKETANIEPVMVGRVEKLLSLAFFHGHDTLVLGAWGCGVFRNDPEMIAKIFRDALTGEYKNNFSRVVFAVPGNDKRNHDAFERQFREVV